MTKVQNSKRKTLRTALVVGILNFSIVSAPLISPIFANIRGADFPREAAAQTEAGKPVRVNVSVWDAQGQPITDLTQDDFTILEQGQPQRITRFIKATAPLRLMILVDASESMTGVLPRIRDGLMDFVSSMGLHDEMAVVTFAREPRLDADFSANVERIKKTLADFQVVREQYEVTQLYDALEPALNHLITSTKNMRNGLLLVTDGLDRGSRQFSEKASLQLASGRFVTVYVVQARGRDRGYLKNLAGVTAGRFLRADEFLEKHLEELAQHLQFHYVLGYVPSGARPAKKPISLQINVSRPGVKVIAPETYQVPPEE